MTYIPPARRMRRAIALLVVLAATAAIALPSAQRAASATQMFADGFETGNLSAWTNSSGLTVQTQQVFAGTYAAANTTSAAWASRTLASPLSQVSLGLHARFASRSTAVTVARLTPASGTWIIQLFVNAKGRLAYRNNVAKVTRTSSQVLGTGRWYSLQVRATVAGSSSTVEVLLDGVTVPELSRTENLGTASVGVVEIGNRPTNRTYSVAIDDVVVDSSSSGGVTCPSDWSTVPVPSTLRALTGVTAVAADDAWAVGFLKGRQAAAATARWNGSSWREVTAASVGSFRSAFNAADAVAANDVWAVGYTFNNAGEAGQDYRTLTQHWNGSAWSVVSSPNQGTAGSILVDVDARTASDAWAVGNWMDGDVKRTLAMRWAGSAWQIVSTPNPGSASNSLTAVATVSATEAWAVGYRGNGTGYEPLVLRWDGTAWAQANVAALDMGDETILTGVSANGPGDVWVVGYVNGPTGYRAMSGHLVSANWQNIPAHDPGGSVVVPQDVAVSSNGDVWGVGFRHGNQVVGEATLVQRWSQGEWATIVSPNASNDDALSGISSTPGDPRLWAVGRSGPGAIIVTACPDATTATAPAEPPLSGNTGTATGPLAPGPTLTQGAAIDVVAVDMASEAGLRLTTHTFPPTVFDYDQDGWPDVMLNHHYEAGSTLYRNRADGTFAPVLSFPTIDRHGCAAGDVNADGRPDLYCTTGANFGTDTKANELWIQETGGWVDRAAAYRALDPFGRARSAAFLDADLDGDLDLYVGNLRERGDGLPSPNRFWTDAGGAFSPEQSFGLDVELRVGCVQTADFDNDSYPDLLVCTNAGPKLYHNEGGSAFADVTPQLAAGLKGSDGTFADLNGDGRLDLAMAQSGYVYVWLQTGTGAFVKRSSIQQTGVLKVSAGDVNKDGLPDLYVLRGSTSTSGNAPDVMLINGGDGLAYSSIAVPGDPGGLADSVEPIDYDRNGQMDFLVMNGDGLHTVAGFTQLIAFFPA